MKLGSFGAAQREYAPGGERDSFEFFGTEFTVEGIVPSVVLLKVCAGMVGEINSVQADAALYELLRHALTKPGDKPDRTQWQRFYDLAAERQCSSDALVSLAMVIMGAQAGKEAELLRTSADGSQPPSTSSNSSASDTPDSPDSPPPGADSAG